MSSLTAQVIGEALNSAGEHCNQGRYNEAMAICTEIIQKEPRNADALHIQGLCKLKTGNPDLALRLLTKALSLRKSDGDIANSLALSLISVGKIDDAAICLEKLLKKGKLTAEGTTTLGDCRLRQGHPEKAKACFERALATKPDLPAALINLGEALKGLGKLDESIQHYSKVTKQFPKLILAWRNLGLVLQTAERHSDSIPALKKYTAAIPNDPASIKSLGYAYHQTGQFDKALASFDIALSIDSVDAEAWNNRGLTLRTLGYTMEAKEAFAKAISLEPDFNTARLNFAHLLHDTEGLEAATPLLNDAILCEPNAATPHVDKGQMTLIEGNIAKGWPDYRWRFEQPPTFAGLRNHKFPPWLGDNLANRTLLVWGEQGIGDEILHAGMLQNVIARAKKVIVEVEPRLVPVLKRSFPEAIFVARSNPPDPRIASLKIDSQISIGDLIPIFFADLRRSLEGGPYLRCDMDVRNELRQKYFSKTSGNKLVGISWHSSTKKNGQHKSIPLEQLQPILTHSSPTFVSLQYGDHDCEISSVESLLRKTIIQDQSVDPLKDFDIFASQVAAMDLVITISNTTAHVAGALGVPVWTLVPRLGTGSLLWYWFRNRSTSPWYNSMTLYRQTRWHEWSDTIEKVSADFQAFLGIREDGKIS